MASATRFEGLLLLIPLRGVVGGALAGVAPQRRPGRGQHPIGRWRLGCLGVLPAVAMLALIVAGLRGYAVTEVLRIRPLILAGGVVADAGGAAAGQYVRRQFRAAEVVGADLPRAHVGNLCPHGGERLDALVDLAAGDRTVRRVAARGADALRGRGRTISPW